MKIEKAVRAELKKMISSKATAEEIMKKLKITAKDVRRYARRAGGNMIARKPKVPKAAKVSKK